MGSIISYIQGQSVGECVFIKEVIRNRRLHKFNWDVEKTLSLYINRQYVN
jgi:hypothetical protein